MSDIMIHIDENTSTDQRKNINDTLLHMNGVIKTNCHDRTSHLMIVTYDSELVNSQEFISVIQNKQMHAELIGL